MNVETTGKELSYTSSKECESSGQRKNLCGEEAPRICISIKFPRNAPGLLTENHQLKERSREKSGRQTDGQTDSEMKKPRCVLPTFIHTQMQRERERETWINRPRQSSQPTGMLCGRETEEVERPRETRTHNADPGRRTPAPAPAPCPRSENETTDLSKDRG